MLKTPVDELFNEVSAVIGDMKKNNIAPPVRVKSCLEHLRSSLEYLANDIYEKIGTKPDDKIYFPYGKESFIEKYLSKLAAAPDTINELRVLLTSIQPYHTGEEWLTMMCNLTNDVKHRRPIPLDQDEVITGKTISAGGFSLVDFKGAGSGNVQFRNCDLNSQPLQNSSYKNGVLKTSGKGIPVNINITKEKKIRFHGHDYEVFPFLERCLNELKTFTEKGYLFLQDLP